MGDRIIAARKKPPRSHKSTVPDSAIDECEKSYEAADEKKEKTHGKKFDDTGLMALVCRHDVVLFLANILLWWGSAVRPEFSFSAAVGCYRTAIIL